MASLNASLRTTKKKRRKNRFDFDIEPKKEDGDAFILALATHKGDDQWSIDSSASFGMISRKDFF